VGHNNLNPCTIFDKRIKKPIEVAMKQFGMLVLAVVLGGAGTLAVYRAMEKEPQVTTFIAEAAPTPAILASIPAGVDDFTTAANKTVHAVVHVKTAVEQRYSANPFEQFFFGAPGGTRSQIVMGSGSGVIFTETGYIVTNYHVIKDAKAIKVVTNDNQEHDATVIGTDPATDLALLKIEGSGYPFLAFANSDVTKVGEWVLAVGNPFNLTSTVTAGIISAKGRNIGIINDQAALESFIQTDAAVNPGNSGGALVNLKGELIGINTAISTHTGSFEGYSFAVPSNIVRKVVDDLLEFGAVQRAFIGVNIGDITPAMVKELQLERNQGVYVAGVTENGAAAEAGLKEGDIITKVEGKPVNQSAQLREIVGSRRPGDKVAVEVQRGKEVKTYQVQLRNFNGTTQMVKKEDLEFATILGGKFEPLTEQERRNYRLPYGVKISQIQKGKLRQAGVPEGFIITKINATPIKTVEDINMAVADLKDSEGILLQGYYPNGRPGYFAFGK
jgi:Do/DeqQ family serine protease